MGFVKKDITIRNTLGAVTPADFEKLRQLRKMQAVALWLLLAMAIVFAISFSLQDRYPVFGFIRAASEGGMVGAIADWFAVTALFRHPLGLKIPHTNLIARKKDDIGEELGSFIEENFLSEEVVYDKLATISGARQAGEWLSNRDNADKINVFVSEVAVASITVLSDSDVQDLFESIVRRHVISPEWGPNIGRALESMLQSEHQSTAVDILADHLSDWLRNNPVSFEQLISSRLPTWVPSFANRFVDKKVHSETIKLLDGVRGDPDHPLRSTISNMLHDLAEGLQTDPALQKKVENLKHEIFTSRRVRELLGDIWSEARSALLTMLKDPESELRLRLTGVIQDGGSRLAEDTTLQYKIDVWVMTAISYLVRTYRHDLANIVSETVHKWDATEAAEKIELQIGKDLQYIRINGTIVGSLAGLTIYTIAVFVSEMFA